MKPLNEYVEHTLLKQDCTKDDLIKLFNEAKEHKFLGVCVNPAYVSLAKENLAGSGVKIVTVVGFPLGASKSEVTAFEAKTAIEDGADEIDMVMNVSAMKSKDYDYIVRDVKMVKEACGKTNLKVILETDLLTKEEIAKACELCVEAGADLVKTSTGFVKGGGGAKPEDVKIMHDIVAPHGMEVKASGGVRSKEDALAVIEAGATRIGTSSGIKIVEG